jgi:hypothetical protein
VNHAADLICRDFTCSNYGNTGDAYCDETHFETPNGPWRDRKVWVLTDKCTTCIFRPGNLMHLAAGRVQAMVRTAVENQSVIPCHKTLDGPRSICRGFWDSYRNEIMPLRLAQAMDIVEYAEFEEN